MNNESMTNIRYLFTKLKAQMTYNTNQFTN